MRSCRRSNVSPRHWGSVSTGIWLLKMRPALRRTAAVWLVRQQQLASPPNTAGPGSAQLKRPSIQLSLEGRPHMSLPRNWGREIAPKAPNLGPDYAVNWPVGGFLGHMMAAANCSLGYASCQYT